MCKTAGGQPYSFPLGLMETLLEADAVTIADIMPCCQIVYLFQFPVVRIKRIELCPSYSLSMMMKCCLTSTENSLSMVGGHIYCLCVKNSSEPVWPSGKALGW